MSVKNHFNSNMFQNLILGQNYNIYNIYCQILWKVYVNLIESCIISLIQKRETEEL